MTKTAIQPYLFFNGQCEEALNFYSKAIGAKIEMMMRYKDSPEPVPADRIPAGYENKVMHASFRVGDNMLMASDGCGEGEKFSGFSISYTVASEAEAKKVFEALSQGGQVTMPLAKTFWAPCFGMLEDRFGLGWMITVEHS
jgi:PhnB protein